MIEFGRDPQLPDLGRNNAGAVDPCASGRM